MVADWYEENIEEPVRDLVRVLRNNGFNTECSCGHEKYIQCQYVLDGEIKRLHNLLYCYFVEKGKSINYELCIRVIVNDGHLNRTLEIDLTNK